ISDYLCRKFDARGPGYDPGGATALRGRPHQSIAARFLSSPYFSRKPPKSTDGPEMIARFEQAVDQADARSSLTLEDALATAALIVVQSISQSIPVVDEIIASGGGIENAAIANALRDA